MNNKPMSIYLVKRFLFVCSLYVSKGPNNNYFHLLRQRISVYLLFICGGRLEEIFFQIRIPKLHKNRTKPGPNWTPPWRRLRPQAQALAQPLGPTLVCLILVGSWYSYGLDVIWTSYGQVCNFRYSNPKKSIFLLRNDFGISTKKSQLGHLPRKR